MNRYIIFTCRFLICIVTISFFLISCSRPNPAPDQTATGALFGAAIQSGAGAIVGHQLGATGPGAAIGAGLGLVSGGLTGFGLDRNEKTEFELQAKLKKIENDSSETRARLRDNQAAIDYGQIRSVPALAYQVYFDENQTNLRSGAITELETLADAIISDANVTRVKITGHSDDTGDKEYNMSLSQKRAESVLAYLKGRGITSSRLRLEAKGSSEPIANNSSAEGRSKNRRVTVTLE